MEKDLVVAVAVDVGVLVGVLVGVGENDDDDDKASPSSMVVLAFVVIDVVAFSLSSFAPPGSSLVKIDNTARVDDEDEDQPTLRRARRDSRDPWRRIIVLK